MEYSPKLTASRRNSLTDPDSATKPEAAVRVFFYVGTPGNTIGKDGDFYLEEETNVLYGPKAWGIWPEEGVKVSGPLMRKRRKEKQEPWSIDPSQLPGGERSSERSWRVWFFQQLLKQLTSFYSSGTRSQESVPSESAAWTAPSSF